MKRAALVVGVGGIAGVIQHMTLSGPADLGGTNRPLRSGMPSAAADPGRRCDAVTISLRAPPPVQPVPQASMLRPPRKSVYSFNPPFNAIGAYFRSCLRETGEIFFRRCLGLLVVSLVRFED